LRRSQAGGRQLVRHLCAETTAAAPGRARAHRRWRARRLEQGRTCKPSYWPYCHSPTSSVVCQFIFFFCSSLTDANRSSAVRCARRRGEMMTCVSFLGSRSSEECSGDCQLKRLLLTSVSGADHALPSPTILGAFSAMTLTPLAVRLMSDTPVCGVERAYEAGRSASDYVSGQAL
jgi:hypothetical protein